MSRTTLSEFIAHEIPFLTRQSLIELRKRAIRLKAWFRLTKFERAAIDLTIRVVKRIRNSTLAQVISNIVSKLRQWMKPTLKEKALLIGRPLAEKISQIAQAWGNRTAWAWARDLNFIMYLGISWINTPPYYKQYCGVEMSTN